MIHFDIDEPFENEIQTTRLAVVIQTALLANKIVEAEIELTLVITGDNQIHELNKEFLGVDSPTDVLSFPSDEFDPDTNLKYIGDIIISYPRADEQAKKSGHSTTAEIELLVVHAVLHLLGYDHAEPAEKMAMWDLQRKILLQLGSQLKSFPE